MINEENILEKYNVKDENETADVRQLKDLHYFLGHVSGETPLIVSEGNKIEGIKPLFMKSNNDNTLFYSTFCQDKNGKINITIKVPVPKIEDDIKLNTHVTQKVQINQSQLDALMKEYNFDVDNAQNFKWRNDKFY